MPTPYKGIVASVVIIASQNPQTRLQTALMMNCMRVSFLAISAIMQKIFLLFVRCKYHITYESGHLLMNKEFSSIYLTLYNHKFITINEILHVNSVSW